MEIDPREIVVLCGSGKMEFSKAVREVMSRPPEKRQFATIYRDVGKCPAFLDHKRIEEAAKAIPAADPPKAAAGAEEAAGVFHAQSNDEWPEADA